MGRVWQFLILAVLAASGCGQKPAPVVDLASERHRMVQEQLMPREEFVPQEARPASYTDQPLPIGYGQTISQPFVVAFMTEQLQLKRDDRVLEIGTGSGYQAAILAELVADVYTIEIIEPLAKNAEATLKRLGYKNVHMKAGDGYKGWPDR